MFADCESDFESEVESNFDAYYDSDFESNFEFGFDSNFESNVDPDLNLILNRILSPLSIECFIFESHFHSDFESAAGFDTKMSSSWKCPVLGLLRTWAYCSGLAATEGAPEQNVLFLDCRLSAARP